MKHKKASSLHRFFFDGSQHTRCVIQYENVHPDTFWHCWQAEHKLAWCTFDVCVLTRYTYPTPHPTPHPTHTLNTHPHTHTHTHTHTYTSPEPLQEQFSDRLAVPSLVLARRCQIRRHTKCGRDGHVCVGSDCCWRLFRAGCLGGQRLCPRVSELGCANLKGLQQHYLPWFWRQQMHQQQQLLHRASSMWWKCSICSQAPGGDNGVWCHCQGRYYRAKRYGKKRTWMNECDVCKFIMNAWYFMYARVNGYTYIYLYIVKSGSKHLWVLAESGCVSQTQNLCVGVGLRVMRASSLHALLHIFFLFPSPHLRCRLLQILFLVRRLHLSIFKL